MAKNKGMGGFWGVIFMVCAVNFIGLLVLIGGMAILNIVSKDTLMDMLQIFRGTHMTVTTKEYNEYVTLKEKQADKDAEFKKQMGDGLIHNRSVEEKTKHAQVRDEEARLMLDRLRLEQEKLEKLRSDIESGKKQADAAREILELEKEKKVKFELSEKTKRLQKTFSNMDAADIANDLEEMSKGGAKNEEYAAHLLSLMSPTQVSEVLTEMDPGVRQELLPLLENPYANMAPDLVVQEWKNAKPVVTPRQMAQYFRSMPPTQMLKIWRRLDRISREDVLDLMAPINTGGR
jgi:flagellar motility protein MotE (MotC chaperone)